ncbi:LytR/AlgR family response regulator transcription factor [Enterococcus mundtii]|uniref:Response regulatory domain-containing protein n=1 Tax=Enterococcus mundtii TaxID=53346 RepID=A0A242KUG9_ENTMU|nr:LytTR family transcriptional regulator DNA-binding domain-containing protein [Enterococcus mundtii]OTP24877.1 hypothetical protein A5802_003032 [Enterococcus mundtii]
MRKIFIIEDNIAHRAFIKNEILVFTQEFRLSVDIICIESFSFFIQNLYHKNLTDTDVFIIDIDLQTKFSGIDIAEKIRQYNLHCKIIFITSHTEKSFEIITKNIAPFDCIKKVPNDIPQTKTQLKKTLKKCIHNEQLDNQKFLCLKRNNEKLIFSFSDVVYIETIKTSRYKIHLQTMTNEYILNNSFSKVKQIDFPEYYITSLRSYIINLLQIDFLNQNLGTISFKNKSELYVSFRLMKKIENALSKIIK